MLNALQYKQMLDEQGFNFFTGVPCSLFKSFIDVLTQDSSFYLSSNEGEAIAFASGAFLGGKKPVVFMQNSGLLNTLSPLVSLNYPFKIPLLGYVSLRGEPGTQDEPQHHLTGEITTALLDQMRIKWDYLATDIMQAQEQIKLATAVLDSGGSFFFVVKKNTFQTVKQNEYKVTHAAKPNLLIIQRSNEDQCPTRYETLQKIVENKRSNTYLLAATGKTGRELYDIEDAEEHFYMVGSMGCLSSIGLGIALAQPQQEIIAIDGDGALLMRLSSLVAVGIYQPQHFIHILLDNRVHDSTGGQATGSEQVDFIKLAEALGYTCIIYAHNLHELIQALETARTRHQTTFIYLRIKPGSKSPLGRPTVHPMEVAKRFRSRILTKPNGKGENV